MGDRGTETILLTAFILASLAVLASAIEASENTPLLLAQCAVGENGWRDTKSQDASMHVLLTRYRRAKRRYPNLTLAMQARGFCKALNSPRRWIRELRWTHGQHNPVAARPGDNALPDSHSADAPRHWPSNTRWSKHLPLWRDVQRRAALAVDGKLPNPAPGACNWGGSMDEVPAREEVRVWYRFRKAGNVFFCH